jgi:acetyl-CoA C-acetyltransferase
VSGAETGSRVPDDTPVLVGVGQVVARDPAAGCSPVELAARAAAAALADTGADGLPAAAIDTVAAIRFFEHSTRGEPMVAHPFGCSDNVPLAIARRIGAAPRTLIYADVGGHTPQRLVNRLCADLARGDCKLALIAGAEAIATIKHALRAGLTPDWRETLGGDFIDEWGPDKLSTAYERAHGCHLPLRVYPLLEQARRHRRGLGVEAYRAEMGALFAPFSRVAAANPWAQFPVAREAQELATPAAENYLLAEPYPKWLVAQDAVNQGAAVLLTTAGHARRLGIAPARWVFLRAYADLDDRPVSERISLDRSLAQELVLERVLDAAGVAITDVAHVDLYSCFPIAVSSACDALDLDWRDARPLTLTGGLPFFGGPGNNYSLHAIAEAVSRVRGGRESLALVVANGGYLSKHSAGLYAGTPAGAWSATDCDAIARRYAAIPSMPIAEPAPARGVVESYVVNHRKGQPASAYVAALTENRDARFLARLHDDDAAGLAALTAGEVFGRPIDVEAGSACNHARLV